MNIAIYECENWECDVFQPLTDNHRVSTTGKALNAETVRDHTDAEIISTFIYSKLNRSVLEQMPNLRMIATRSTGIDHIDLDYCRENGVMVCNVPTYGTATVAEHTFALLLAVCRKLPEAIDRTRRGDFSPAGLQGLDLYGKTIGVVGTGSIGAHVVRIAQGFDMRVLAYDVKPREELTQQYRCEYVDMDTLLVESDFVTLHVPSIPQTYKLIGAEQFRKMKRGAILINTSRGSVVDTTALTEALANGTVAAAGLDVLPQEPVIREEAELLRSVYQRRHEQDLATLLADNVLLRLRNVVITPHNAFNTVEAVTRILETTFENIDRYLKGEPVNVAVSPEHAPSGA